MIRLGIRVLVPLWSLIVIGCSIASEDIDGSGRISGSTSIDNPVAEVLSPIAFKSVKARTGLELWLYEVDTPQEKFATTTIDSAGDFTFENLPYGDYDIMTMDNSMGSLYRHISLTPGNNQYVVESLGFYSLREKRIKVNDGSVSGAYFYDVSLASEGDGIYSVLFPELPPSQSIVHSPEIHLTRDSDSSTTIVYDGMEARFNGDVDMLPLVNHCTLLPGYDIPSESVGVKTVSESIDGTYYIAVEYGEGSAPESYIGYGNAFGFTFEKRTSNELDAGVDAQKYSFDLLEFDYEYVKNCCTEENGVFYSNGRVITEADTTAVVFVDVTKELMLDLGFDCWDRMIVE
ncbi:MAG: carboxypeptidase-like regulatory domain-containing protein [Fibrobacterales bacterium]